MSSKTIIKNVRIVNAGEIQEGEVLIENTRISRIGRALNVSGKVNEIDGQGKLLMPGIIDDQVHFREPGLTYKADIASESRAGIAGGVTSYMEMPNTNPPAITIESLEDKYNIASKTSWANYSFFMGATNDNFEELMKVNLQKVCGIKIFMGSSTGNMLVDNKTALDRVFSSTPALIATHCEDEETVRKATEFYKQQYGDRATAAIHPFVRNQDACYISSSYAVNLAKRHGTRLHVLHISTGKELDLFDQGLPLEKKKITAEACVHHLTFCDEDYIKLGNRIKCNPAIKTARDRDMIWQGLKDGRIDIIATDHAPHTLEEKNRPYFESPSGLPLIQHSLNMMYKHVLDGRLSLTDMVYFMSHAPAICFNLLERGYIQEGYYADLVLFDPDKLWQVQSDNILYKCAWSPLEGETIHGKVLMTWVNGHLAFDNDIFRFPETKRLLFSKR
jgi:dihydroorotase